MQIMNKTFDSLLTSSAASFILPSTYDNDLIESTSANNEQRNYNIKSTRKKVDNVSKDSIGKKIDASRVAFMIFICTLTILSFFLFIPISQLYVNFNYQCPLYSNIYLRFSSVERTTLPAIQLTDVVNTTKTSTINVLSQTQVFVDIDQGKSKWESMITCEYCLSISVLILCYCVISLFFFVMFNMHDIIDNDDCLILPWLIITLSLTIALLVANCLITNGFSIFCFNMLNNASTQKRNKDYFEGKCSNSGKLMWSQELTGFYIYFIILIIFSWLAFANILIIDFLLIVRIRLHLSVKKRKLMSKNAKFISYLHSGENNRRRRILMPENVAESKL